MVFMDLKGTSSQYFQLQKGGPKFKNNAGEFTLRNAADGAYASILADVLKAAADSGLILNADAAGAGADWTLTISRPAVGMTANLNFVLPANYGSASQVLTTDGAGNLTWSSPSIPSALQVDVTSFAFGTSSPITLFTLPANAMVEECKVIIDTPFDGAPSTIEVGLIGTLDKYLAVADNDLVNSVAGDSWSACKNLAPVGSTEALIATYSAGGATAGAGRIIVKYVIPS